MFTGIVEEIGCVQSIRKGEKSAKLAVRARKILERLELGDSIAVNGVCLTVSSFTEYFFEADVMAETMRRTNLGELTVNMHVNLERALRLSDRLGGHLVSGHVDGVGIIKSFENEDNAVWVSISASPDILKYVIPKGSVAIDGISLTAAYVDEKILKVSIIPHTGEATTLLSRKPGEKVNLECDMIGKYVEKLLAYRDLNSANQGVDMQFLERCGFL